MEIELYYKQLIQIINIHKILYPNKKYPKDTVNLNKYFIQFKYLRSYNPYFISFLGIEVEKKTNPQYLKLN